MDIVDEPASVVSAPAASEVGRMFDAHADTLFAYAARRVGRSVAADVVADVFVIAIKRLDSYRPELGSERAWLYGITNNVLRHHWRTEARRLAALGRHQNDLAVGDPLVVVDDRLDAEADTSRVLRIVTAMNPDDRDLLVMFAWEQLSYRDIAVAMSIPVGTVRSRLHRIRERLREHGLRGLEP